VTCHWQLEPLQIKAHPYGISNVRWAPDDRVVATVGVWPCVVVVPQAESELTERRFGGPMSLDPPGLAGREGPCSVYQSY
jgi:hypothetical protein